MQNEDIRSTLLAAGWEDSHVAAALGDELIVPAPPKRSDSIVSSEFHSHSSTHPIAVVQNLSVRGFEYSIMFLTLWAGAFSLMWLAISFVNDLFDKASGSYSYGVGNTTNAFIITVLLVTFPIFAYMFLRLKRVEHNDPGLKLDPSRRKLTQMTQLVSFIVAISFTIYFIYSIITPESSSAGADSIVKRLLQTLVALVVAGGIFLYYWREDRR